MQQQKKKATQKQNDETTDKYFSKQCEDNTKKVCHKAYILYKVHTTNRREKNFCTYY
jgi:hypothetical protein